MTTSDTESRVSGGRRRSIVGRFLRLFIVLTVLGAAVFAFVHLGVLGRQMPAVQIAKLTVEARSRAVSERWLVMRSAAAPAVAGPAVPGPAVLGPALFAALPPEPGVTDALVDRQGHVAWSQGVALDRVAPLEPDTVVVDGSPLPRYARRLHPLPGADLSLLTQKDITGDPIRTNILLGLGLFAGMLVLGAWMAARYVVRPLQQLQQGARRLARGERDLDVDIDTGDEVAALAHDFNAMAETVAARERELEAANEALRTANEALEQASALKTMFLANVSHELRTPLTAVIGFADLLRDGLKGPVTPEQVELLDKLVGNAKSLQMQIDDLLDVSTIEAGGIELRLEDVPVQECLEAAYSAVEPQIRAKRLEFTADVPASPLVVRGDYRRLVQIFVNLLANAVKFTDTGSIVLTARAADLAVEIEVRDSGAGIPENVLPHIFDAFRQGEGGVGRKHGGAGLGLAICRSLVELHGGDIHARSTPGAGSTFTVRLPRDGGHP